MIEQQQDCRSRNIHISPCDARLPLSSSPALHALEPGAGIPAGSVHGGAGRHCDKNQTSGRRKAMRRKRKANLTGGTLTADAMRPTGGHGPSPDRQLTASQPPTTNTPLTAR